MNVQVLRTGRLVLDDRSYFTPPHLVPAHQGSPAGDFIPILGSFSHVARIVEALAPSCFLARGQKVRVSDVVRRHHVDSARLRSATGAISDSILGKQVVQGFDQHTSRAAPCSAARILSWVRTSSELKALMGLAPTL